MVIRSVKSLVSLPKRVVTQPREELDRWQKAVRFAYDLCRYGGQQLRRDRAPQMAAALAFRTLFALLPVLIVAMIVVKSTQGMSGFLALTNELFLAVDLDDIRIVLPLVNPNGDTVQQSMSLANWLQGLVRQAGEINLAAVGWVGVALISYAALSLMMTIENGFNVIYSAPQGRRWTHRVPLYWFVLTMSPVVVGLMLYVNTFVAESLDSAQVGHILLTLLSTTWNLSIGWLILFTIYTLMPNATVDLRPAAVGALVSSLLIEIGKGSLGAYLDNAFAISQLYGSLGLIPLFMFWVYLMWLTVLFGLEVSATLQALHGRELESISAKLPTTSLFDSASVISVMETVAKRFTSGQSTTARFAGEECSVPESVVRTMFARLIDRQILHSIDGETTLVSLAMPPKKIRVEQLLEIGFDLVYEPLGNHRSEFVWRLREAQRQLARQTTLATLVTDE